MMRRFPALLTSLLVGWAGLSLPVAAETSVTQAPTTTAGRDDYFLATGATLGWTTRNDYGQQTWRRFMPESVTYFYLPLVESLYLRPGARLGYAWIQQQMPQAIRIEERDVMLSVEAGLVWDWYIIPSFALGGGIDHRTIKLKHAAPIESVDDKISTTETLPFWHAQLGAGIPIARGRVVVEPFARYWAIQDDDRSHWTFGLETTVGFH